MKNLKSCIGCLSVVASATYGLQTSLLIVGEALVVLAEQLESYNHVATSYCKHVTRISLEGSLEDLWLGTETYDIVEVEVYELGGVDAGAIEGSGIACESLIGNSFEVSAELLNLLKRKNIELRDLLVEDSVVDVEITLLNVASDSNHEEVVASLDDVADVTLLVLEGKLHSPTSVLHTTYIIRCGVEGGRHHHEALSTCAVHHGANVLVGGEEAVELAIFLAASAGRRINFVGIDGNFGKSHRSGLLGHLAYEVSVVVHVVNEGGAYSTLTDLVAKLVAEVLKE